LDCSNCGSNNPQDKRFCLNCGSRLHSRCRQCGSDNPPGARFCGDCGASLTAPSPFVGADRLASPPAAGPADERKTVTALFADIRGSTTLIEELDPEDARAIIDPALALMVNAIHRYEGYVVQSTGDGIFALFGAPVAQEDHAQRAVHAALAMQEALRAYRDDLVASGKSSLETRIGVNTGEVVLRDS
jgi:class 3 adenylate cyclase/ribosomal protein L40E